MCDQVPTGSEEQRRGEPGMSDGYEEDRRDPN